MEINGKVYRNLEGQVGYLTDKYDDLQNQINDVRAHLTHYVEVDTLPTGDDIDPSAVYLLGPMGTAPDQYYEEWVYVQKADESWVWEKLGDTDSVDLSGYLEKQTGTTTNPQAYVKNADGTQGMVDVANDANPSSIMLRDANGRTKVAAPYGDGDAVNLTYANNNYLAKDSSPSSYDEVYGKTQAGVQTKFSVALGAYPNTIPVRDGSGRIYVGTPAENGHAATKKYVDNGFLAKQTGAGYFRAYTIETNGTQSVTTIYQGSAEPNTLVYRTVGGQVVCADPTAANHAATKNYVDAAVGQLLYLHDIEIIVTIDASNKLYIKAYLVNGSGTAIASINSYTFMRMDVQYGCFGADVATGTPCAVTKKPDGFAYGDFDGPRQSYLYQYISGGSLVSGETTNSMTVTVSDTVISF